MGTWHTTCAVTQLPIVEGTPVVMIPLVVKPVDHLARDNISGSGSTSNNMMAQPLSLPLRGKYSGTGGIESNPSTPGLATLETCLEKLASDGKLYKLKSAEPIRCKKLPRDFLSLLSAGDLLIMSPNPRKAWLTQLHKVYNESEDKGGFSHYRPQLKVDPATLPDLLPLPLALNFVPATLYDAMAKEIGTTPGFDDWKDNKHETFDGTRGEQVIDNMTLSAGEKSKMDLLLAAVDDTLLETVNTDSKDTLTADDLKKYVQYAFLRNACHHAFEQANHLYFSPYGIESALTQAIAKNDATVRNEIAAFSLFSTAMDAMRKQWVPQTGAGSSRGLDDDVCCSLYALASRFVLDAASPTQDAPKI